jgi:large subunit ribosomal protein L17
MRHRKHTFKIGRTAAHRRCLIANMLKSLIEHERIETGVTKAKELRRHADRLVTLAKQGTLASRREVIARLMIRYNPLTSKEARAVKESENKNLSPYYNTDRRVVKKLYDNLAGRFSTRQGGFTRIVRLEPRIGDNAEMCFIEYLPQ